MRCGYPRRPDRGAHDARDVGSRVGERMRPRRVDVREHRAKGAYDLRVRIEGADALDESEIGAREAGLPRVAVVEVVRAEIDDDGVGRPLVEVPKAAVRVAGERCSP